MKATDFANYFDFDIQRCDTGYEVSDLQACFDTRYIQDVSDMVDDNDEDDEARRNREMNELLWNILKEHFGHEVEIVKYGDPDNPASICLEDIDTNEVILDAKLYTICARED